MTSTEPQWLPVGEKRKWEAKTTQASASRHASSFLEFSNVAFSFLNSLKIVHTIYYY